MIAQLFIALSRTSLQIFLASGLFLLALIYRLFIQQPANVPIDIRATTLALGSIGSILALATSVSFAFVVFFVNQTNSRKHDLFYKFKTSLFDFDRFLKDYPSSERLVSEAQALSWSLKFVKLSKFPLGDWEDRLAELLPHIDKDCDYEEDPNLKNKILGYLGYMEEIVSEIGIMCIRQVIAGIYIKIVIKAFILIGLLLLVLVISYLNLGSIQNVISSVMPVFFATFACLIFLELGWYLYREGNELLDFVHQDNQRSDPNNATEAD